MKTVKYLKSVVKNDEGAVTVDWVVITAMVCGLCIAAYTGIESETVDHASDIAATIENQDVTGPAASAALGTSGGD